MSQNGYIVGRAQLPLTSSTASTLLNDADPVVHRTIAYLSGALSLMLGARWDAQAALTSLSGTRLVGSCVPYDASLFLNQLHLVPPVLSVYNRDVTFPPYTAGTTRFQRRVTVDFVLPPMGPAEFEQLGPIRTAVVSTLAAAVELGAMSGHQSGTFVWGDAGVQDVRMERATFAEYPNTGKQGTFFPLVRSEFTFDELTSFPTSSLDALHGIDSTIQIPSGTVLFTGVSGTLSHSYSDFIFLSGSLTGS